LRVLAALSGLLFAGLGVALLYPVSISALVAAMPDRPAVATARASLASGVAVTFAPLLLAALSDSLGLRTAYLLVPALLLVVVLRAARRPAPRLVEGRQACTKRARRRWLGSPAT
jgi:MFS family permease